jgi:hypothetical protein
MGFIGLARKIWCIFGRLRAKAGLGQVGNLLHNDRSLRSRL